MSLCALAQGLAAGEFSSRDLTTLFLDRAEAANPHLNAFITLDRGRALAQADAADARRAAGARGALLGIPVAHKDLFCAQGWRTTCASRMLADFVSPYDAQVVERLRDAGTVLMGKTNMDEFAMGSSSESSWFGPVKNPWRLDRVPGGSSGGSAAAVAAGLVPAATASDTGGSIRQPAAFTGTCGIKPTYGRVSRHGMVAFASSLDQGGAIARSAEDLAIVLSAMAGPDARDSTCSPTACEDYTQGLGQPLAGLTVGVPREYFTADLAAAVGGPVTTAIATLAAAGARVVEVSLPNQRLALPAYYVIAMAEASSNLSRYDGVRYGHRAAEYGDLTDFYCRTRAEGFGAEVKRRILIGTYVLSHGYYDAYYRHAQQLRRLIADDFAAAFSRCDVLVGPVAPTTAFPFGHASADPVQMYLADLYTISVNLAGLPAMSIPCGFAEGLPVGLQLIGNAFREAQLLAVAHQYQLRTDWHRQAPDDRYFMEAG
jgi:aspartyl-tRNA(Asn)/glutamyl-tRNA(Gln) amidotransferase subunit A